MGFKELAANNVEFNEWANRRFLAWLSIKADEVLFQEVPSSYPSIFKTLKHIWEAQEFWWGVVAETDDLVKVWELEGLTKDQVFAGLEANSQKLTRYVKGLSEDELAKRIKIDNQWMKCDLAKYEYIQQFVNHAIYHRGQIVTIGRNLGLTDPPSADFIFWRIQNSDR